ASIHWREAWKYGMRAYRYCQHDCGHALAAIAYAAACLGWRARLLEQPGDGEIAALLGLGRADDLGDAEREAPDALMWISASGAAVAAPPPLPARWHGRANRLSSRHVAWPDIDAVDRLAMKPRTDPGAPGEREASVILPLPGDAAAATLIRTRRSAVAFDGE